MFLSQDTKIQQRDTTQGVWTRLVLSVDLVANYVRAYVNLGDGPGKVMDETWLQTTAQHPDGEQWIPDEVIRDTFLGSNGPLALSSELQIASDVFSTTRLGALTLYRMALAEDELKLLAGSPGSPTSFLLDVSPRRDIELTEADESRLHLVTVKLLHPPLGSDSIVVSLNTSRVLGRVSIEPASLTFGRANWTSAQDFRLSAVDDAQMQQEHFPSFEMAIETSIPVLWPL